MLALNHSANYAIANAPSTRTGIRKSQIQGKPVGLKEIPKAQRRPLGKPLSFYAETFPNAKEGMKKAYASGDYTMQQIADAFGVNYSTVNRAVNKC